MFTFLLSMIFNFILGQATFYSSKCSVCSLPDTVSAYKIRNSYYLEVAGKKIKIGTKLTKDGALIKYTNILRGELGRLCTNQTYSASDFLNFTYSFSEHAVSKLFLSTSPNIPIVKDSIQLAGSLYLDLIITPKNTFLISLLGKSKAIDLFFWNENESKYQFNTDEFKNNPQLQNAIPEILFLKDSIAGINPPALYLLPDSAKRAYEIIVTNPETGDQGIHSGVNISATIGDKIKASNNALILIDSTGKKMSVVSIKEALISPKTNQLAQHTALPNEHTFRGSKDDSTGITVLTAANFDFSGKLSASYLGLFNIFAPNLYGKKWGFIAGIEKINYSNTNINGIDSSQVLYQAQNFLLNPLLVSYNNLTNTPIINGDPFGSGTRYLAQENEYTFTSTNTVWSFYFQPMWRLLTFNQSDLKQGLYLHLHTELVLNQWSRSASVKNLYQDTSYLMASVADNGSWYWVQKNPIINNYNFIGTYFGAGATLYVNPFPNLSNSFFSVRLRLEPQIMSRIFNS
jgi:hypothetical protein